jgi:hypothetical protein
MNYQAWMRTGLLGSILVVSTGSFFGCATSSTPAPTASAADAWWHEGEAIARDVQGSVETSPDGQVWSLVQNNQVIAQGGYVRTGVGGSVRLDLGPHGGGILKLMPDSQLKLAQLGASHVDSPVVAVLDLERGQVMGDTLRLPDQRKIQVRTPSGMQEIH